MTEPETIDGIKTITLEIPREAFANEEDYQRALRTSREGHRYSHLNATGMDMLIPDAKLVDVIVALVNQARAAGMGVLHDKDTDREEVEEFLRQQRQYWGQRTPEYHIDYFNGRPIKMNFTQQQSGSWLTHTRLYNRDQGRAEEIILVVLMGT